MFILSLPSVSPVHEIPSVISFANTTTLRGETDSFVIRKVMADLSELSITTDPKGRFVFFILMTAS